MTDQLRFMALRMQWKLRALVTKENGEVNVVAIVVLIGIAVILALIFRKQITNLLNTLFGTVESNAQKAIKE